MNEITVLLVDDDCDFTGSVGQYLARNGCHVLTASAVEEGISCIRSTPADIVILDLNLKGESGLRLLEYLTANSLEIPVAVLTGYASLDSSIEALRLRAVDYLLKPVSPEELLLRIKSMTGKVGEEGQPLAEDGGIVGVSRKMVDVVSQILHAAKSSHNVLVTGESGTGKELVARAIHDNSARRAEPFITCNCAALGETLFHGEMFGYRKGSYTGAEAAHDGYLKVADGGSLFLDEIGEISLNSQVKLLRVLETGEFNQVGDTHPRKINVRFIAATNRDIRMEVDRGTFRLDLYYRLNIFHIHLPPLRDRKEDISSLVEYFLSKHRGACGSKVRGFSRRALEIFEAYSWPGNVRQLEGAVVRALTHCPGTLVTHEYLPMLDESNDLAPAVAEAPAVEKRGTAEMAEIDCLMSALTEANGNVSVAADIMGINRATIYRKIAKYKVDLNTFRTSRN